MGLQTKPRKILIVDDDPIIRDWFVDMLSFEVYDFQIARNGLEAMNILRGEESYLVFLDLMMPPKEMDGEDVCDQLGTEHNHVIILISALDNLNKASSLHVHGTLPKPLTTEKLIATIEQYLE